MLVRGILGVGRVIYATRRIYFGVVRLWSLLGSNLSNMTSYLLAMTSCILALLVANKTYALLLFDPRPRLDRRS